MALNPVLDPQGVPAPFVGEMMVLMRRGIEFHVDNVPSLAGGKWAAKGVLYLSTVRMVFVSTSKPTPSTTGGPPLSAFDMPLLFVHGEKFNQPIFGCNNITGKVLPVQSAGAGPAPTVQLPHSFNIYFMEGGVGTFLPLFSNMLQGLRATNPAAAALARSAREGGRGAAASREQGPWGVAGAAESMDPLPSAAPVTVMDSMRSAYVDPNDPTVIYVEQPSGFHSTVTRRRGYTSNEQQT